MSLCIKSDKIRKSSTLYSTTINLNGKLKCEKYFFFPFFFVLTTMSESDTDTTVTRSSITRSSVSTSHEHKKCKHNTSVAASDNDRPTTTIAGRANQSHTSYFFYKDPSNNEIAYCIICKRNPETKAYPYSRKGGSTSNMSNHLRDKHNITKHNYLDYLDGNDEVNY
jgi:hypothetical protein